jgi:molybdopterin-biosynthesis enzyme MoeA-like protein
MDTNSNWLAKRVNALGWTVERITLLRDSLDAISDGGVEALKRKPELVFTIGGLGPTYDDMTLKGLSIAIRRPLILNQEALALVMEKYERMERPTRLTGHRRKMAMLPKGSKPLPNPVGTAPGILVKTRNTTIISFPGVPQEMKAIFNTSVIPILKRSDVSSPREAYLMLVGIIESALAPVLEQVRKRFSTLYFKSHPIGRETGVRSLIKLHVYTVGKGNDATIRDAVVFLLGRLASS